MTTVLTRVVELDAPTPERRTATLLDTFTPNDGLMMEPGEAYVSLNCLAGMGSQDICDDTPDEPDWQDPEVVSVIRFVTDIGIRCSSFVGWDGLGEQFDRVLDLTESAAVEQAVMSLRFTGTEGGDAATNITPAGGAVIVPQGVALLEGDAATKYAGQPTIHSPVSAASLLSMQYGFKPEGRTARTPLGSKFVIGAGYEDNVGPTGAAPAAGEKWMYSTGELRIGRGRPLQLEPQMDRSTNVTYLRRQRVYVVDVDCYISAVRVKIT